MSRVGFQHAIDCATPAPVLTATVAERLVLQPYDVTTAVTLARLRHSEAAA